jgi:L-ascorbate metabolism protein UlaG (beta-lactamase superfamily)
MQINFVRHATLIVAFNGFNLLVDPMLSPAGAMEPVANAANQRRIPLVGLPYDAAEMDRLLAQVSAVLVTHTHRDHWDAQAIELLPKSLPVLCQPDDVERISAAGFSAVQPIAAEYEWQGVQFIRTGGRHGSGEIGQRMGPVSGFVLTAAGEPRLYIAGDTIWCPEVEEALRRHHPDVSVVNAGAAQFLNGGPITMTAEDVGQVCRARPGAQVIAVHMEAINHCLLTRAELSAWLHGEGLAVQVQIPLDGTRIEL